MTRPRRNGKNTDRALMSAAVGRFVDDFGQQPYTGGVVDGIAWVTCLAPTWGLNGYVLVPAEGHPWSMGWPQPQRISKDDFYSDALDELLEVHGGVTYRNHPWVGFDTAHGGDRWPQLFDPMGLSTISGVGPWGIDWTVELVEFEAQKLARQVAAYGKAEGGSIDWARGVNVELSDEFTQMRRATTALRNAGAGARSVAEAMDMARKAMEKASTVINDLAGVDQIDITPPPTTGRFQHLDHPTVQELNTDPPNTP